MTCPRHNLTPIGHLLSIMLLDLPSLLGQLVTTIVTIVLVAVAAAKPLSSWVGARVATAVDAEIKHRYDRSLEELRAELTTRQGILGAVIAGAQTAHMASHERRIKAVEELWSVILAVRALNSSLIFPYQMLLPQEYESGWGTFAPIQTDEKAYAHELFPITRPRNPPTVSGDRALGLVLCLSSFLGPASDSDYQRPSRRTNPPLGSRCQWEA